MTNNCVEVLPLILLGFRSSWRDDLKATPAAMVYGTTLRLPGQFFPGQHRYDINVSKFVEKLRVDELSKTSATKNNSAHLLFLPLQPPYERPFP